MSPGIEVNAETTNSVFTNFIRHQFDFELITNVTKRVITNHVPAYLPSSYMLNYDPAPPPVSVPVTIISPLVDSDVLDLSASSRSQNEFSLALSFALRYAGLNGQANAFEQFVKNRQSDTRLRTQDIAVNAFSGNDGRFGFQIGPRRETLNKKSKETDATLSRQSFPSLLILRLGAASLKPAIVKKDIATVKRITDNGTNANKTNELIGVIQIFEPVIRFSEISQWAPLKHQYVRDSKFYQWYRPLYWRNPALSESERLKYLVELNAAQEHLTNNHYGVGISTLATNLIGKRIAHLEGQLAGGEGRVYLPADTLLTEPVKPVGTLQITSVAPGDLALLDSPGSITNLIYFVGTNLAQIDFKKPATRLGHLPGNLIEPTNSYPLAKLGDQMLGLTNVFSIKPSLATNEFDMVFQLTTTNNQTFITLPVHVVVVEPAKTRGQQTI